MVFRSAAILGASIGQSSKQWNIVFLEKRNYLIIDHISCCDGIFAIVNGTPPDEGVMVELGMAIAWNKAIFLFRDDFRRCTDSEQYPLNLMLFAGLPKTKWEDYYYTSVEEIGSSQKALYQWLISS